MSIIFAVFMCVAGTPICTFAYGPYPSRHDCVAFLVNYTRPAPNVHFVCLERREETWSFPRKER